jgi:hypothetical protein
MKSALLLHFRIWIPDGRLWFQYRTKFVEKRAFSSLEGTKHLAKTIYYKATFTAMQAFSACKSQMSARKSKKNQGECRLLSSGFFNSTALLPFKLTHPAGFMVRDAATG